MLEKFWLFLLFMIVVIAVSLITWCGHATGYLVVNGFTLASLGRVWSFYIWHFVVILVIFAILWILDTDDSSRADPKRFGR